MLEAHLKILSENLDLYSSSYGKCILLLDFNVRIVRPKNEVFLQKLQFERSHKAANMPPKLRQTDLYWLNTNKCT